MNQLQLAVVVTALLALQACVQQPSRPTADSTYCDKLRGFKTCIAGPIPSQETDRHAKQFAPRPDALVLYVVRDSVNDRPSIVSVVVDGKHTVATVPHSLARITVPAGRHQLAIGDHDGEQAVEISGSEGEIRIVQIVPKYGLADFSYRLRLKDDAETRRRAQDSRLIADIMTP